MTKHQPSSLQHFNPHFSVSHGREGVADGGGLGGHGEQGGHPQGNSGWRRLWVNPEGEPGDVSLTGRWEAGDSPGHDDQHAGGDVDGEHVVGELPAEGQLHEEAAVLACCIVFNFGNWYKCSY